MKSTSFTFYNFLLALCLFSLPLTNQAAAEVYPTGDAAAGAKVFKKCKSCHMIKTDSNVFIQKGGKTGPNLWGLKGRVIGSTSYRYGKSIIEVGESGLVWDKKNFIEQSYLNDLNVNSRTDRTCFQSLRKRTKEPDNYKRKSTKTH